MPSVCGQNPLKVVISIEFKISFYKYFIFWSICIIFLGIVEHISISLFPPLGLFPLQIGWVWSFYSVCPNSSLVIHDIDRDRSRDRSRSNDHRYKDRSRSSSRNYDDYDRHGFFWFFDCSRHSNRQRSRTRYSENRRQYDNKKDVSALPSSSSLDHHEVSGTSGPSHSSSVSLYDWTPGELSYVCDQPQGWGYSRDHL